MVAHGLVFFHSKGLMKFQWDHLQSVPNTGGTGNIGDFQPLSHCIL